MRGYAPLFVGVLGVYACSGAATSPQVDDAAPPPACVVGESRACACVNGLPGAQVCGDDGRLGRCDCVEAPSCLPAESRACACTNGLTGAQVCSADRRLGPCVCERPTDSAAPGPVDATLLVDVSTMDTSDSKDAVTHDASVEIGALVDATVGDDSAGDVVADLGDPRDAGRPEDAADAPPSVDVMVAMDSAPALDGAPTIDATTDAPGTSDAPVVEVGLCSAGQRRCGGTCIDVATSSAHCGGCDHPCLAGTLCIAGACGTSTSAWRTFGGDSQHTGNAAAESGVPPLARVWTISVASGELWPVVVEAGRVFVTAPGSHSPTAALQVLRVSDGSLLWRHPFGQPSSVGQPALADGAVYVAHNKGVRDPATSGFWSLDAATGAVRWLTPFPSQWEIFYAPIVEGGRAFSAGGAFGGMYAYAVADGRSMFFRALDQYDAWSPAYADGFVYSYQMGRLRRHDPVTGTVVNTTTVPWTWSGYRMNTAPVFDRGRAFLLAPPNLNAVNPETRAIEWTAAGGYSQTPAVADGVVYAVRGSTLVALDANTGDPLWTYAAGQTLAYPPVIAAGRVYVASVDHVHAVNLATHAREWLGDAGGWLSIAEGRLFVARRNGELVAYSFTR